MNWKVILASAAGIAVVAIPSCMRSQAEQAALFAQVEDTTTDDRLSENWSYRDQVDEMRKETTRVASIKAEGYVPMSPELFVLRDVSQSPVIGIRGSLDEATAPQMRCLDGSLNIKFDDGPIKKVGCMMGMAVGIDPVIFPQLKKSKSAIIEIETSLGNSMQYKFRTANLKI